VRGNRQFSMVTKPRFADMTGQLLPKMDKDLTEEPLCGCRLIPLSVRGDERGSLVAINSRLTRRGHALI